MYFPLGKAFEKQIKTIDDQGEKQIKAIQDQGQVTTKIYLWCWRYFLDLKTKIFNKRIDERLEEIADLDEKVDNDGLIYRYKGRIADAKFDKFDNALDILNKIKNGEISLAEVKNNQEKFKSYLGQIKRGNSKEDQKSKKHFVQYWNAL